MIAVFDALRTASATEANVLGILLYGAVWTPMAHALYPHLSKAGSRFSAIGGLIAGSLLGFVQAIIAAPVALAVLTDHGRISPNAVSKLSDWPTSMSVYGSDAFIASVVCGLARSRVRPKLAGRNARRVINMTTVYKVGVQ